MSCILPFVLRADDDDACHIRPTQYAAYDLVCSKLIFDRIAKKPTGDFTQLPSKILLHILQLALSQCTDVECSNQRSSIPRTIRRGMSESYTTYFPSSYFKNPWEYRHEVDISTMSRSFPIQCRGNEHIKPQSSKPDYMRVPRRELLFYGPSVGLLSENNSQAEEQIHQTAFPPAARLATIWTEMIRHHGLEKEYAVYTTSIIRVLASKTLSLEETKRRILPVLVLTKGAPWYLRLRYLQANHYDHAIASGICHAIDTWRKYSIEAHS